MFFFYMYWTPTLKYTNSILHILIFFKCTQIKSKIFINLFSEWFRLRRSHDLFRKPIYICTQNNTLQLQYLSIMMRGSCHIQVFSPGYAIAIEFFYLQAIFPITIDSSTMIYRQIMSSDFSFRYWNQAILA